MEVFDMYVDRKFILALAERVLNMKTAGKEDWCIHWLEWFWQQEIETAIYDAKRRRPRCALAGRGFPSTTFHISYRKGGCFG